MGVRVRLLLAFPPMPAVLLLLLVIISLALAIFLEPDAASHIAEGEVPPGSLPLVGVQADQAIALSAINVGASGVEVARDIPAVMAARR